MGNPDRLRRRMERTEQMIREYDPDEWLRKIERMERLARKLDRMNGL